MPLVLFPWVVWNLRSLAADPRLRVCACLYALPLGFFLYKAIRGPLEGNWALACYIGFWPLAAYWYERVRSSRRWRWSVAGAFALPVGCVLALFIHLLIAPLPVVKPRHDRLLRYAARQEAFAELAAEIRRHGEPLPVFGVTYQSTALLRVNGIAAEQLAGATRPSNFTLRPRTLADVDRAFVVNEGPLPPSLAPGFDPPRLVATVPVMVRGERRLTSTSSSTVVAGLAVVRSRSDWTTTASHSLTAHGCVGRSDGSRGGPSPTTHPVPMARRRPFQPPALPEHVIDRPDRLPACIDHLRASDHVGFDTEFVGEDSYRPDLCLVQIATREHLFLIDPLGCGPLDEFWDLLHDPNRVVVVHAGREEVRMCRFATGRPPTNVADVQVAAALVGMPYPIGYAGLVQEVLGARAHKGETLTDWRRRPLTPNQMRYAFDDVRYLLPMWERLSDRLKGLKRGAWAVEEFKTFVNRAVADDPAVEKWRRLKGLGGLDRRELAVARGVFVWREEFAARLNRPPRVLLRDDLIVEIARRATRNPDDLHSLRGVPRGEIGSDPHRRPTGTGVAAGGLSRGPRTRERLAARRHPRRAARGGTGRVVRSATAGPEPGRHHVRPQGAGPRPPARRQVAGRHPARARLARRRRSVPTSKRSSTGRPCCG